MTPTSIDDLGSLALRYAPDTGGGYWRNGGRQFALTLIARTAPIDAYDAYRMTYCLGPYLVWAHEQDLPNDPERSLTPSTVEHYFASGARTGWAYGTRTLHRWVLRRVGMATTRRAPWEPRATNSTSHKTVTFPYLPEEIALYRDAAPKQRTLRRSRYMQAALAFHHGAGLQAIELHRLHAHHLERRRDH